MSMFRLFPNNDRNPDRGVGVFAYENDARLPIVFFDHANQAAVPVQTRVVFLLREPLDVLVSNFFQMRYRLGAFAGGVEAFVLHHPAGISGLVAYLNGWAPRLARSTSLVISYESMHENMSAVCRRVLSYLNCPVDEHCLARAVADAQFARMQRVERSSGFSVAGATEVVSDPNALRARAGKVGGYVRYLSAEAVESLGVYCQRRMRVEAKRLLLDHSIGYQLVSRE